MKPLLEIKDLNINYKNSIKAIKNVNFILEDNQIISIVGESGSGKSTLIRAILKLLPMGGEIESGNIFFLEKDILNLNKNELNKLRGKDIGMIFQDPNSTMDPIKTIEKQFLEYILEHNNISKKEAIELAKEYLLKLNLTDVDRVLKSYPFELSGGMKQRVAIAMAMAQSPRLLLADEPTSALDVTVQAQVIQELKRIRETFKTAIILVTHNMGVASYISDKIAVMMKEDLLIIENISKTFKVDKNKELKALKNVNIQLKQGECIGIVGESGCGKSTLARIIVGIEKKTSGKIIFNNKEIEGISKTKDIQMIFQNPLSSFNPRMKIIDYMWEPLRNYFNLSKKDSIPLIKKSLIDVGLDENALEKYPHEFSGGQLQRITIARAIIIKPKLIVCDEITSALDVSVQKQILELLKKLQKDLGLSYLFIGHDLAVVQDISQKIVVMYMGEIVEELNSIDLKSKAKHPYTKLLLNSVFEVDKI